MVVESTKEIPVRMSTWEAASMRSVISYGALRNFSHRDIF
jgi:hypothetical protein